MFSNYFRGVAQPGRVLRSGRRSQRFESSCFDQFKLGVQQKVSLPKQVRGNIRAGVHEFEILAATTGANIPELGHAYRKIFGSCGNFETLPSYRSRKTN